MSRSGTSTNPLIEDASPKNAMTMYNGFANPLEHIVDISEHAVNVLQKSQSPKGVIAGSVAELWDRYGSAMDNYSAKLYTRAVYALDLQRAHVLSF